MAGGGVRPPDQALRAGMAAGGPHHRCVRPVRGPVGSLVLPLAALVCGTVWARQRQVTGSIVPSLVSHVLWSLLMFLYIPGLPGP